MSLPISLETCFSLTPSLLRKQRVLFSPPVPSPFPWCSGFALVFSGLICNVLAPHMKDNAFTTMVAAFPCGPGTGA